MLNRSNLSQICPYRLNETYHSLFEKQQLLGISDEYLLRTVRFTPEDEEHKESLKTLLELLKRARDNVITWYLKQTLSDLNVTVSLVTAKIKLIEYKLGFIDGLDLHQASSIALVDFSNIISDLTVINTSPVKRKTMHKVTAETNIPAWLIHYRNLICHVPSEGPHISILIPLVQKSLDYMKDSFWSKVLQHETFDERKFRRLVLYLVKLTHVENICKYLHPKRDNEVEPNRNSKSAQVKLKKHKIICTAFRRALFQSAPRALDILARTLVENKFDSKSRQYSLLLVQLTVAKCFERFLFKLLALAEESPRDKKVISWLIAIIRLVGCAKRQDLSEELLNHGINAQGIVQYFEVAPIKCCRIAYRLVKLDGVAYKRLLIRLRHKLLPILGKQRTLLLIKMTRISGYGRV